MRQVLRLTTLLLCLLCGARAYALDIPAKPAGGVEAFLPDYGVTVAVVAYFYGGLGEGLAILEKKPDGTWYLCAKCFPSPVSSLAVSIAFKGGAVQYIESERPTINARFAERYPPIGTPAPLPTPTNPREQLNAILPQSFTLGPNGLQPK